MHDDAGRRSGDHDPEIAVSIKSWLDRIEQKIDGLTSRMDRDLSNYNTRLAKVEQDLAIHVNQIMHQSGVHEWADLETRLRGLEMGAPSSQLLDAISDRQGRWEERLRTVENDAVSADKLSQFQRWLFGFAVALIAVGVSVAAIIANLVSHGVRP